MRKSYYSSQGLTDFLNSVAKLVGSSAYPLSFESIKEKGLSTFRVSKGKRRASMASSKKYIPVIIFLFIQFSMIPLSYAAFTPSSNVEKSVEGFISTDSYSKATQKSNISGNSKTLTWCVDKYTNFREDEFYAHT